MKVKLIPPFIAAMLTSTNIFAGGFVQDGYLYIEPDRYMYGTMSVRFNEAQPSGVYMQISSSLSDGSVVFSGKDFEGEEFMCRVPTSSSFWRHAYDLVATSGNGMYLDVRTDMENGTCTSLKYGVASFDIGQ